MPADEWGEPVGEVELPEWPEEPVDCPTCAHTDLDHDETGCTVAGCPCVGPE